MLALVKWPGESAKAVTTDGTDGSLCGILGGDIRMVFVGHLDNYVMFTRRKSRTREPNFRYMDDWIIKGPALFLRRDRVSLKLRGLTEPMAADLAAMLDECSL